MRILIVDDEFVSRQKAKKILSAYGDCDEAGSGSEAFLAFRLGHESGEPYDLITMDIVMPDMDGLEALKKIREYEKQRSVPPGKEVRVLMLTAKSTPKTVISSFWEGCEAYVLKPFDREALEQSLGELNLIPPKDAGTK